MKNILLMASLFLIGCGDPSNQNAYDLSAIEVEPDPYTFKPSEGVEVVPSQDLLIKVRNELNYQISNNIKYFQTNTENLRTECGENAVACYFSEPKTIILRLDTSDRELERCTYLVHEWTHEHLFNTEHNADAGHSNVLWQTNTFYKICREFLAWDINTNKSSVDGKSWLTL